jgi:microcystin-dependent protein
VGTPFIGEIRMFGGNFAPVGWVFCAGQNLQIAQNDALYSLIGTTYGGDGQTTFKLPDLQGRVPVHQGTNPATGTPYPLGQQAGTEQVTLTLAETPIHTHAAQAQSANGTQAGPGNGVWATELDSNLKPFSVNQTPSGVMNSACLGTTGGSQPHDNVMPFLAINFIIALEGIYPSKG